jgi:murein DD-endopeptidase MepM/ murein hydrolase activator NlpD
MSWDDIMRRMLPPIGGVLPHITGPAGAFGAGEAEGRGPGSSRPHKGVDVNYVGGQGALNKSRPILHAPVDGEVIFVGGRSGTISIKDSEGFVHKLMHTATQNVRVGDRVTAGDSIGTVGNTGTKDYHLHYQLEDSEGRLVNSPAFWNRENRTIPVPSPPPHLDDFQLAAQISRVMRALLAALFVRALLLQIVRGIGSIVPSANRFLVRRAPHRRLFPLAQIRSTIVSQNGAPPQRAPRRQPRPIVRNPSTTASATGALLRRVVSVTPVLRCCARWRETGDQRLLTARHRRPYKLPLWQCLRFSRTVPALAACLGSILTLA